MRNSSFLVFLLLVSFAQISIAQSSRPACVRTKDATALVSLVVKAQPKKSPRKVAGKNIEEKKENPLKIPKYTPVSMTGKREGRWREVQNMQGQIYWMRSRDLSTSMNCLSVRVEQSRMYQGPGPTFGKGEIANRGDVFLDLGGEDGWIRVQNEEGKKSWINLDHIWKPSVVIRMSFPVEK